MCPSSSAVSRRALHILTCFTLLLVPRMPRPSWRRSAVTTAAALRIPALPARSVRRGVTRPRYRSTFRRRPAISRSRCRSPIPSSRARSASAGMSRCRTFRSRMTSRARGRRASFRSRASARPWCSTASAPRWCKPRRAGRCRAMRRAGGSASAPMARRGRCTTARAARTRSSSSTRC
jgi:hypothetical protein